MPSKSPVLMYTLLIAMPSWAVDLRDQVPGYACMYVCPSALLHGCLYKCMSACTYAGRSVAE